MAHWLQWSDIHCSEKKVNLDTYVFQPRVHLAPSHHCAPTPGYPTPTTHPWPPHPWPCPLPLGVSAPLPAGLFQNVSFSPRLCCLFYRSLSLCCERLRLLVMEVNLTNLWISLLSLVHTSSLGPSLAFTYFYSHFLHLDSLPIPCSSCSLLVHWVVMLFFFVVVLSPRAWCKPEQTWFCICIDSPLIWSTASLFRVPQHVHECMLMFHPVYLCWWYCELIFYLKFSACFDKKVKCRAKGFKNEFC